MEIILKNLIPKPLLDVQNLDSELWLKSDFLFSDGKYYLIYSQSGKGKTSLLSIFYGLRHDYEGEVLMDGKNIRTLTKNHWVDLRRNKISMVFQGLKLFDKLTVEENIILKNQLTNFATQSEILSWLDALDIKSLYKKRVGEISFGQQQRVALVRALCQPFELLLLDEPFSHIDEKNRTKAMSLIQDSAKRQNAGIILSGLNSEQSVEFQTYRI